MGILGEGIRNIVIRGKVELIYVVDKMSEERPRWFGHVKRRCEDLPIRRWERLIVPGFSRGRAKPKKSQGR